MLIPVDDDTASEAVPWVTYLLIAVNLAVFFAGLYLHQSNQWILHYGHRAAQGISLTMVTAIFLHASLAHLLGNLWFLWITGDNVEGRLGHLRYLLQIMVPLSKAPIMTLVLFGFIASWNSLAWPILVTTTPEWRPVSYGLLSFLDDAGAKFHLQMAGSMITMAPVLLLYFFTQKTFIEGISTTGLKG